MSTELANREPTILDVIREVAAQPDANVGNLERLWAMQKEAEERTARTAFYVAMKNAQDEMVPVLRNRKGENNRYADLEAVDGAIRPIYTKHGFSLSFDSPEFAGADVTVCCTCFHTGGYAKDYKLAGSLDDAGPKGGKTKTPIQALGSTVKYLRRYLECMIFNVMTLDNDTDGKRGPVGYVTREQSDNLQSMLDECGISADPARMSRFLRTMEATTVDEIMSVNYRVAINLLEETRRQRNAKGAK